MEFHYRGFYGKVFFAASTNTFYGEIINCRELLSYQGETPVSARLAAQSCVDCYLSVLSQKEAESVFY